MNDRLENVERINLLKQLENTLMVYMRLLSQEFVHFHLHSVVILLLSQQIRLRSLFDKFDESFHLTDGLLNPFNTFSSTKFANDLNKKSADQVNMLTYSSRLWVVIGTSFDIFWSLLILSFEVKHVLLKKVSWLFSEFLDELLSQT